MNATLPQAAAVNFSVQTPAEGADLALIQKMLIKEAREIDSPMAMASFAVSETARLVPCRKAALFVDGAVRAVRADSRAARSRKVVRGLETLARNLVNQRLDAPCVIDQCVDYVKDTSDVVAPYDFYPEQMIWIPWLSGGGRNAELRGGLLLERQQEWTTSDIARLNKLVAVYAQSVDAMPATFPPPEKPSKLSALRLGLSAAVVVFSLVMASLSWALMDAEAVSPGAGEALFSIESTDPGSSPESYI